MATTSRPRMYFNFRSPYSWLALHDLTTRYPDLAVTIEWLPAWEPDPATEARLEAAGGRVVYTPMSREKHFYVLGDVRRLAGERGLCVAWPFDRTPRWEVSHLAFLVAQRSGLGKPFAVAVSRARWEHGRDISDPTVVGQIGASLGLAEAPLVGAAEDPAVVAAGIGRLIRMYRDGVFGMPFFIHGREKFWGVDRLGTFARSVRSAGGTGPESEPAPDGIAVATSDDGHAGGCG